MPDINDLKFLSVIKLMSDRTLTPKRLITLEGEKLDKPTDLASYLTGLDVIKCVESSLKLDDLPEASIIYEKLLTCWTQELSHLMRILKPSRSIQELINTYLSIYAIKALHHSLITEGSGPHYPVLSEITEGVRSSQTISELLRKLKSSSNPVIKVLLNFLTTYPNKTITEIDPHELQSDLLRKTWLRIRFSLKGSPKAVECVSCLNAVEEALRSVRSGEEISKALSGLSDKVKGALIDFKGDPFLLESALKLWGLTYCDTLLTYYSFSNSTILRYLLVKDWETSLVTYVLNLLKMGFPGEYVQKKVRDLVKIYELFTQ